MGSAFQTRRGDSRRLASQPRVRQAQSPLDRAAAWEVDWKQAAPVFEAARPIANASFVYFIGEEDRGAIKIGSAKDPILRLRGLQTGNPRRLQVEYVLVGDVPLERLLQEFWELYATRSQRGKKVDALPGTEWFRQDIRDELEPILESAVQGQRDFIQASDGDILLGDLERIARDAHSEHGFVAKGRDEVRLLGETVGYAVRRRSRI